MELAILRAFFMASAFALISSLYESYARDLEGSVAPYNPEAAMLCSKKLIRNLEIKGETGSVSAICLFISDDNAALETLVSDQLTSILSAQ